MKLRSVHSDCIWCRRRLVPAFCEADCSVGFGPRPRSDEHIIPKSIFGKIVTTDLCRCCNSVFGESFDFALLEDPRIFEAAKRVGITAPELFARFEGTQRSATGREYTTVFENGTSRTRPHLGNLDRLGIAASGGRIDRRDLIHLENQLVKKVRNKQLPVDDERILHEVRNLLEQGVRAPEKEHHNRFIGERLTPSLLSPEVIVRKQTRPWETEWCLAKVVFELSQVLWPADYRDYGSPFLEQIRGFLERREVALDGRQGPGIFRYTELPIEAAKKEHRIEGIVSRTEIFWELTFFGTARWTFSQPLRPIAPPPAPGWTIKVTNPFRGRRDDSVVEVSALPVSR